MLAVLLLLYVGVQKNETWLGPPKANRTIATKEISTIIVVKRDVRWLP